MITQIAYSLDALLAAFAFGATVWFFFVQSPVLIRWMGKEKFIPIQMKLTRALFTALAVTLPVMAVLSFVHSHDLVGLHVVTAAVAVFGALVNAFVVVPRALRAGGRSMKEVRAEAPSHSVSDFASRGGGDASKVWHRLVVLFVVVMLGGLVAHGSALLSPPTPAADDAAVEHHHHADEPAAPKSAERWKADSATTQNVHRLLELTEGAIKAPPADDDSNKALVKSLSAAYQQVFTDCTMKGEAHEELHEFLRPVFAELQRLESGGHQGAPAVLKDLGAHLSSYDTQFE